MAPLSGCYSCVKYLMFAFNFLFWLLGCTVLAVGIWITIDPAGVVQLQQTSASASAPYGQFLSDSASYGFQTIGAYLLIGVGTFIALVGFLGCCGAIRESQFMLASFFVALSLTFSVLLATGVFAILAKNDMEVYIQKVVGNQVRNYYNNTEAAALMDFLQSTFKCCGATDEGVRDYKERVPSSCANNIRAYEFITCCVSVSGQNYLGMCMIDLRGESYLGMPCPVVIYHELTPNLIIIAGVAIGISVVLLMGMLFSIMLCCAIRSTMT